MNNDGAGSVTRIAACDVRVGTRSWAFARTQAAAIDAHWAERCRTNPAYFNGVIHVMADPADGAAASGGVFQATLIKTDFKSFLYWRETGYPHAGVKDVFGSAILRSREGHVLLGRQSAGHINAGLAYLPGGFIDGRDVSAQGHVDVGASIARELYEETHLTSDELITEPGFTLTVCGPQVSLAQTFRSPVGSAELRGLILRRLAADPDPELADIVIVRSLVDLRGANVPPYTAQAVAHVFAHDRR